MQVQHKLHTPPHPSLTIMVRYDELTTTVSECYPSGIPVVLGNGIMGYNHFGQPTKINGVMNAETFISRLFQTSAVGEELINWLFMQLFYSRHYYLEGELFLTTLQQHIPQYIDHWIGCTFTEGVDESGEVTLDYDVISLIDNNAQVMHQLFILFIIAVKHRLNHLGVPLNVGSIHVTAGQLAFYIEAEHQ